MCGEKVCCEKFTSLVECLWADSLSRFQYQQSDLRGRDVGVSFCYAKKIVEDEGAAYFLH
jgi:hypothetical protein